MPSASSVTTMSAILMAPVVLEFSGSDATGLAKLTFGSSFTSVIESVRAAVSSGFVPTAGIVHTNDHLVAGLCFEIQQRAGLQSQLTAHDFKAACVGAG